MNLWFIDKNINSDSDSCLFLMLGYMLEKKIAKQIDKKKGNARGRSEI